MLKITTIKIHIPSLILALIAIVSFFIVNSSLIRPEKVTKIINENTIELSSGKQVRLIGVSNFTDEQIEDKKKEINYLNANLLNKKVYVRNCSDNDSPYKYIWFSILPKDIEKNNISYSLLNAGLCEYSSFSNDKYDFEYRKAATLAKFNRLGIWK